VKPVVLTRHAASELAEGRQWYEQQRHGLGSEFVAEFRRAATLVAEHPRAAPRLARGYRRRMLHRFPYGLVYLEDHEVLLVVAVWHSARNPKHLIDRLR